MSTKRVRTSNFTELEENILLECILRRSKVIESKKTDACTLKEKQRVWEEIVVEFNSLCSNVARQSKALKDKYANMKTALRKQFAAEKTSRKETGGGKEMQEWHPKTEALAELARLISLSIHGTSPTCDDDDDDNVEKPIDFTDMRTAEVQQNDTAVDGITILDDILLEEPILLTEIPEQLEKESWSHYNPTMLRKPNKHKLKRANRNEEDSLQNMKKKLIERELEMREIKHQQRFSHQQKEHEARIALLDVQKQDYESKVKLRQIKIANFTQEKSHEITDSE